MEARVARSIPFPETAAGGCVARLCSDQPLLLTLHHFHFQKNCGPITVNDETEYQGVTLGECSGLRLTFRHRASCILGQAFHCSPENAFYIFNQQIQGGSNMTGIVYTCKQSRSYLNHLVYLII